MALRLERMSSSGIQAFLVKALLLSSLVQQDDKLAVVVQRSLELTLPACLRGDKPDDDKNFKTVVLPSKSTLSKARILMDVAWCMLWQHQFDDCFASSRMTNPGAKADAETAALPSMFMLADSSPQFGADWFICELSHVDPSVDPVELFCLVVELAQSRSADLDALQRHSREMGTQRLQTMVKKHCLIPTALGSARASTQHKIQSWLYALFMDFQSWSRVRSCCVRIVSFTSDFGPEANMPMATLPEPIDGSAECAGSP